MKRILLIDLLEDGENLSLYSPRFEGETYTEFEKFLLKYKDEYPRDIAQIVYRLDIVKRDGAADRHFRYEGKILILGNGGLKKTATYQEDKYLNGCVETLQKIDIELIRLEQQNVITITGTKLLGTLTFVIDD